ncbi:MAG: NAD-dependent epimerase/dehydratase family protein [Nitrososphaerales archaeon]
MTHEQTVLITGVGGYWGSQVAARLLTIPGIHVMGLDTAPPKQTLEGLDFIQADVRNPLLTDLLSEEGVDTVVHLAFLDSERPSEACFDVNVMGTMKVFGAAAAAGVRKIVIKSSTMVYGAKPDNSAFLPEERGLTANPSLGSLRDRVEIEAFCNGFRGQNPGVILTVLRFPGIVGPKADTFLTRFLSAPLAPVLLGFDPMMQVIHEEDVGEALVHAVMHDAPGVFNVAAEGVLPFSKLRRLAGKHALPVFHLAAYWGNPVLAAFKLPVNRIWPVELDYLRYPWVGDLTKMRHVLGFTPRYTAAEALREFAGRKRLEQFGPESPSLSYDEERLRDTIERRRRARSPEVPSDGQEPEVITDDIGEEVA